MKKLNLAIIGQGRSGKQIHGDFLRSGQNEFFNVKYVVDADKRRREKAEVLHPGCQTFESYTQLFDLKDIDLVVNSSYSQMHYPITKDLLEHNFNVLVEKPFARNRFECETLIKLAEEKNLLLAVFQQSFFAPYYLKACQVIESGVLGDIQQINITHSGLCRRWDWQTLQKKMAGSIYNTGPHPIGLALGFLDFDKNAKVVYSKLATGLTSGDAEDYAKILLTAPNKPLIDIEISALDAYPSKLLKIQGTRGTFVTSYGEYACKYVVDGENEERPVQEEFLQNENGEPMYCVENLITHEESGLLDEGGVFASAVGEMYKDIYFAITEGKPMRITPQMATEIIAVIDKVHADNPLPLKF